MPTVRFEATGASLELPDGGALAAHADAGAFVPVPFGCRRAVCAVCAVRVLEGSELCHPPGRTERALLARFRDPTSLRLACQLVFQPGDGLVRLGRRT